MRLAYDDSCSPGRPTTRPGRATTSPTASCRPITALWVDEGRDAVGFGRVADPSAAAAATFARALERAGIRGRRAGRRAARRRRRRRARPGHERPARPDRRAGPRGQRQRGRRGAGPARRPGGLREGLLRRRAPRGRRAPCAGSASASPGPRCTTAAGCRARTGSTPTPWSTCCGWPRPRTTPTCGHVLTGLPVAGFTGSLAFRFADGPRSRAWPGPRQDRHPDRGQRARRRGHRPGRRTDGVRAGRGPGQAPQHSRRAGGPGRPRGSPRRLPLRR